MTSKYSNCVQCLFLLNFWKQFLRPNDISLQALWSLTIRYSLKAWTLTTPSTRKGDVVVPSLSHPVVTQDLNREILKCLIISHTGDIRVVVRNKFIMIFRSAQMYHVNNIKWLLKFDQCLYLTLHTAHCSFADPQSTSVDVMTIINV